MKLHVGQRLRGTATGGQPGGYVVTEVVAETPWYGLYAGKKIFANFDFAAKRVRETDNKEWLDVFLRTVRYPILNDPGYVSRRRELARAEVRRLGVRRSNLWPEPLDLLEIENSQDRFGFEESAPMGEPVAVFARPHGKLLGEWLMNPAPGIALLAVLAEVLDFIAQAHAEGLLLNGLGPATLLIDRAERVHYLGGDLAVEEDLARGLDQAGWLRLYPTDRYPRGFAPPECYQGRGDRRSDLYSWGALAFSLLTGIRPWQVALEQGRSWATFQEPHFTRLEQALLELPGQSVASWADQLGLQPEKLQKGWPSSLMGLFRRLLHADPRHRPGSVPELLAWMEQAPPPLEGPVVAFFRQEGQVRVFLELANPDAKDQLIVRRGVGVPPPNYHDGTRIYAGPYTPWVDDLQVPLTPEPIYYSAFLQPVGGGQPSLAASAEVRESSPEALRRWAEEFAEAAEPPRALALAFHALGSLVVAEALMASAAAPVRGWAALGLAPLLRGPDRAKAENLLARALRDSAPGPRLQAARVLLEAANPNDDAFALSLLHALGQNDVDDSLDALQTLRQRGVRPEQLARLLPVLEGERPATCPACHIRLPHRQREEHLRSVHGYLDVAGHLLPRDQAMPRLWDRVFHQADHEAHEKLLHLFGPDMHGYVMALEMDLSRRPGFSLSGNQTLSPEEVPIPIKPYWTSLRQTSAPLQAGKQLLRSTLPLARAIGRETVLPLLAEPFTRGVVKADDLRRDIEQLCPGPDLLDERLILARSLAAQGVDSDAVESCLAEIQLDRSVVCDQCGAQLRLGDFDAHLRRVHGVFQFRGQRQSYEQTRALMIDAVCNLRPDRKAFDALVELAGDRHPHKAGPHLTNWLCYKIRTLPRERRAAVIEGVAQLLAEASDLAQLLPALTQPQRQAELQLVSRRLALAAAARCAHVLPAGALSTLKPLLVDKTLSRQTRQDAVVGLLAAVGNAGPRATEILAAYVGPTGKLRGIAKLQELEKRLGQLDVLDAAIARLEDQVRMDCPRCGVELQRKDMIPHLWDKHRLVLEGRRVREPWHQIADWIIDYRLEKDAAVLEKCRELALRVDPGQGRERLERLLLCQGLADRTTLLAFQQQAEKARAGLCPACFAQVPVAKDPPLPLLAITDNALEGYGYRVTLVDRGLFPRLEIEMPREGAFRQREPGRGLTRHGSMVFLMAPLILLIWAGCWFGLGSQMPWPVPLALCGGAALVVGALNYLLWPGPAPLPARLVDAAWRELIPVLEEKPWTREGLSFATGLCLTSRLAGDADVRAETLYRLHKQWTRRAADQEAVVLPLVALTLLAVHDAVQTGGQDPLVLLADEAARSLAGKTPLSAGARLLDEWHAGRPPHAVQGRLTVLMQARAFQVGLEIKDLLDLAKQHKIWIQALGLDDLDLLTRRRLLWSLMPTDPWRRWSRADSVFELGESGEARAGTDVRRLLIQSRESGIALTSQGICWGDLRLDRGPCRIDVIPIRDGYELLAGPHRLAFRDNPVRLADELDHWQHFYFGDFLPRLGAIANRPASDQGRQLRKANSILCPGCSRWLMTRPGEVGVLTTKDPSENRPPS